MGSGTTGVACVMKESEMHDSPAQPKSLRKLATVALAAASFEWYDFFIYGTAAALVFPSIFFPPTMPHFVAQVAAQIREIRPGVRLSAAVYGYYPGCADTIGQDWGAWLKAGYVDFVCPMNYTPDLAKFESMLRSQVQATGAAGRLYPGLGVTATESRLNALQVGEQIRAVRDANCGGFALFDLNMVLRNEVLPILSLR